MNDNKKCEICGHIFESGEGRYAFPDKIICIKCQENQSYGEVKSLKDKTKYYLMVVWCDIEPEIRGPFKSAKERDKKAIKIRNAPDGEESGIFPLDITSRNVPEEVDVWAYSNMFFEEAYKNQRRIRNGKDISGN